MVLWVAEERLTWQRWVTSKPLRDEPIHRWLVFPHSFTGDLVEALVEEWGLGAEDRLVDPFVGAGTTLLAARRRGIPSVGFDLLPLAAFAARVKTAEYDPERMRQAWDELRPVLRAPPAEQPGRTYPALIGEALPGRLLAAFDGVARAIDGIRGSRLERDFFRLALIAILPRFSRRVASGGWLRSVEGGQREDALTEELGNRVEMMLADLGGQKDRRTAGVSVAVADARHLPLADSSCAGAITSPPYPNRHDYTRVFGVELMFSFLNWEETRRRRYQSFQSHPEARPERPPAGEYRAPERLLTIVERVRKKSTERRIAPMIEGYFLDMYLCLCELRRVCRPNAQIALVVGNTRYCGELLPVDELTIYVGRKAGLIPEKLIVTRYRGNSAQQMREYGRMPAQESVLIFRTPPT